MAKSQGGSNTFQQSVSGSLAFTPAEQVRWSTRGEYTVSDNPRKAATDITSSLEVSF